MSQSSKQATGTLKMTIHQSTTVIGAVGLAITTGLITHANTLSAHGIVAPEDGGDGALIWAGVTLVSGLVAYLSRPIAVKTKGLEEVEGTIWR